MFLFARSPDPSGAHAAPTVLGTSNCYCDAQAAGMYCWQPTTVHVRTGATERNPMRRHIPHLEILRVPFQRTLYRVV
jgi:hypothetical protein